MNIKQLEEAIQQAATELEEGSQIRFPDADSRDEFIHDCAAGELDKYSLYDRDPFYTPDFSGAILDLAKLYGYTT